VIAWTKAESAHWALFADWCAAAGVPALPADPRAVQSFLAELPAARSTRLSRVRTIRIQHARLGMSDPCPPAATPQMAPDPILPEVLSAVSVHGWPAGVAGRRDAFLLVLYRGLALTRQQIRNILPTDLDVAPRQIQIRGHLLTPAEAPGECMACAVTRWLRLLNLAEQRDWATVRRSMAGRWTERAGEQELHDCQRPLGEAWRRTRVLLPQVDQYGWIDDQAPLTVRSITDVAGRRSRPLVRIEESETNAVPYPTSFSKPRFDRQRTLDELAGLDPLLDRLDAEIETALQRAKDLLT